MFGFSLPSIHLPLPSFLAHGIDEAAHAASGVLNTAGRVLSQTPQGMLLHLVASKIPGTSSHPPSTPGHASSQLAKSASSTSQAKGLGASVSPSQSSAPRNTHDSFGTPQQGPLFKKSGLGVTHDAMGSPLNSAIAHAIASKHRLA